MRTPLFTLMLLAGVAASPPVSALDSSFYGITGLGITTLTAKSGGSPTPDGQAVGIHLGLGYRVRANLAVEFSVANLGRVSGASPAMTAKYALSHYSHSVVGFLPQNETSAWFLRLGLYHSTLYLSTSTGLASRAGNSAFGQSIGWQTDFSKLAGWRFEYERLPEIGDATTGTFSANTFFASLYYGF